MGPSLLSKPVYVEDTPWHFVDTIHRRESLPFLKTFATCFLWEVNFIPSRRCPGITAQLNTNLTAVRQISRSLTVYPNGLVGLETIIAEGKADR